MIPKHDWSKILRWIPALAMMAAIFIASATPSRDIPVYGAWDLLVKKGGHFLGYGILALALLFAVNVRKPSTYLFILIWVAFYAITDEYHQAFTPGRHSSLIDSGIDTLGAMVALAVSHYLYSRLDQGGLFRTSR